MTVAPSRIASGGLVKPTLTSNVRVMRIGLRRDLANAAFGAVTGSSVRLTVICGSAGAARDQLRRHIENSVAPILACERHDHLTGLDDFSRAAGRSLSQRQAHPP